MEFEFPDTGEGVTEGEFLEWLVEEGEEVEEDQILAEAETDKAVVDIPAPADGVVRELKVKPGDTVKVGQVIMILDEHGSGEEEPEEEIEEPEDSEEVEEEEETETVQHEAGSADVLALPKVRKMAEEKGVDLESLGIDGRITEADVEEASGGTVSKKQEEETEETEEVEKLVEQTGKVPGDVKATPATRKLAREEGVDLSKVEGSGRAGKITREDVLDAAEEGTEEKPAESVEHVVQSDEDVERVKMSAVRKQIASEMERSRFTAPHVTHMEKADVTELVELREREKEEVDVHLTYLPFIIRAAQLALTHYPDLNAELDEENDEIVRHRNHDFNIAVDTDRGLMVPLVENIGEKSILEIAREVGEKAGKAKNGELDSGEMRNGTFSITNLGVIGGDEFTPIINYPQVAILGIGAIKDTAEVVDGGVVPRKTVKLSLSYDHRVVDGATAARFMNELVENLEDPDKLMMQL